MAGEREGVGEKVGRGEVEGTACWFRRRTAMAVKK